MRHLTKWVFELDIRSLASVPPTGEGELRGKILVGAALAMLAAVALVSTANGSQTREGAPSKRALTSITYSTSFGNFGRDAYAWVALEKGYFRDAGFDVKIVPGAGSVAVAQAIAAGSVDFGPADVAAVALARAESGVTVKVVALIQQNTMAAFLALKSSGITKPTDLAGKTFADTPGSTVAVLLPLYAKRAGFDASSVKFVPSSPQALASLLVAKRVDAVGQFTVGIPTFRAATGQEVVSLPYAKVVPGLVGLGLLASDKMIKERPGDVKKFTAALLKGERWAIDNPGAAGAILNKYVPLQDPKIAADELKIMKKYAQTPDVRARGYGLVDKKRIASTISIVNNFFHPKNPASLSQLYAPGFAPSK
jgi:NitT/TauT family transport system substrate-binding protein